MTYPQNPFDGYDKDGLPIQNTPNPFQQQQQFQQPPVPQPQQFQHMPMQAQQYAPVQKSMLAAALLAFFLGGLGVHNFYLGYSSRGVTQLVLTLIGVFTSWLLIGFLFIFVVGIWAFIEFILILVGNSPYDRDSQGVPLKR